MQNFYILRVFLLITIALLIAFSIYCYLIKYRTKNSERWYECKKTHVCEKDYVWSSATCVCENGKYLASIMDDSTIISDEVIKSCDEEIKTFPINFNEKKVICKICKIFIFYVSFY